MFLIITKKQKDERLRNHMNKTIYFLLCISVNFAVHSDRGYLGGSIEPEPEQPCDKPKYIYNEPPEIRKEALTTELYKNTPIDKDAIGIILECYYGTDNNIPSMKTKPATTKDKLIAWFKNYHVGRKRR